MPYAATAATELSTKRPDFASEFEDQEKLPTTVQEERVMVIEDKKPAPESVSAVAPPPPVSKNASLHHPLKITIPDIKAVEQAQHTHPKTPHADEEGEKVEAAAPPPPAKPAEETAAEQKLTWTDVKHFFETIFAWFVPSDENKNQETALASNAPPPPDSSKKITEDDVPAPKKGRGHRIHSHKTSLAANERKAKKELALAQNRERKRERAEALRIAAVKKATELAQEKQLAAAEEPLISSQQPPATGEKHVVIHRMKSARHKPALPNPAEEKKLAANNERAQKAAMVKTADQAEDKPAETAAAEPAPPAPADKGVAVKILESLENTIDEITQKSPEEKVAQAAKPEPPAENSLVIKAEELPANKPDEIPMAQEEKPAAAALPAPEKPAPANEKSIIIAAANPAENNPAEALPQDDIGGSAQLISVAKKLPALEEPAKKHRKHAWHTKHPAQPTTVASTLTLKRPVSTETAAAAPVIAVTTTAMAQPGGADGDNDASADNLPPNSEESTYKSQGLIIRKHVTHLDAAQANTDMSAAALIPPVDAQHLAALVPSAGGNSADVPLIPIPDPNAPPPVDTDSQPSPLPQPPPPVPVQPVPVQPVLTPLTSAPPVVVPPEKPIEKMPPAPTNHNAAAAAMPVAPKPEAAAPEPIHAPEPMPKPEVPKLSDAVASAPLPVDGESDQSAVSVPDHIVPLTTPAEDENPLPPPVHKAHVKRPVVAPTAADIEATITGDEPRAELTNADKKILNQIPSHLNQKSTKKLTPVTVDRAKDFSDIDLPANTKPEKEETVTHESMGIKIEVKTPPMNYDYELEKAYNALTAGDSEGAVVLYKRVLDNDPNNTDALFGLATTYHRSGQIELARPLYARLLSIDPTNRDGLNNFLVLIAEEAPDDALRQLTKLEERNPGFSPIPAQLAIIYQKLGNYDKASQEMTHAIELAPENLTYRYNFAIMLDKQHNYMEAAKLYKQIIEAYQHGEKIPGNIDKIQQRLTFISSNR